MTEPEPLPLPALAERRTTSDQLVESLRDAILSGRFKDGDELNQVALAKHYGVSRVPIREALRQLQAEGLVTAKAHYRTVVNSLTPERVLEIVQVRALIESFLLERAAANLDGARLDQLEELCNQMDQTDDHAEWLALNRRFHEQLYERSRSSVALDLSHQLSGRIGRYLHMHHSGILRQQEANQEHRQVLSYLRAGDVPAAVEELTRHISHTGERAVALLAEEDSPADERT